MRPTPLRTMSFGGCVAAVLWVVGLPLSGQAPAAPKPAGAAPPGQAQTVKQAWDDLLSEVIPQAPVDPVLKVQQTPFSKRPLDDFENHLFFESKTEYIRSDIWFTGNPTVAQVINAPNTGVFNPAGIPYTNSFQPSANGIYEFLNFGTHGWLSDRLNTNFSVRYRQDLTNITAGSPFQSAISAFPSSRRLELLTGVIELHGGPGDGVFTHSSLAIGRQNVYSADHIAQFDGVSFSQQLNSRTTVTLFGGRRFSYYDDPYQRAIGGGSVVFRLPHNASLQYENEFYVRGAHKVTVRKGFGESLTVSSFFGWVGGSPTEFQLQAFWIPRNGKSTIRAAFYQKLTDKDYRFDEYYEARHLDPYNQLNRLNLGPESQYSQFHIDARRELARWLRVGGTVVVRRLNDNNDQAPFDVSFDDFRVNLQIYPVPSLELFGEYHLRDSHRDTPLGHIGFDDVSIAGEQREQDFRLEARRAFFKGRLALSAGGFYRSMDLQDRFYYLPNMISKGVIGGVNVRLDHHTRAYFNYSLDDDYRYLRPDLERAQVLRVGLIWKY